MPEKATIKRARQAKRQGKAPSTQAGEFVREEIEHVRRGKHGVQSPEQAIAIGLSKARRAGVKLPPPKTGSSTRTVTKRATSKRAVTRKALSRHAKRAAHRRSPQERSAAARRAARTRRKREAR